MRTDRCNKTGCIGEHFGLTADEFHDLAAYNGIDGRDDHSVCGGAGICDYCRRMAQLQYRFNSWRPSE